MKLSVKRQIRRSQTVAPFGVGAIYDFGEESFIAMDITHWKEDGETIHLQRLEEVLAVENFRMAAVSGRFNKNPRRLPFMRFPSWLFCPKCRRMRKMRTTKDDEVKGEIPVCPSCAGKKVHLVPMRFVSVCAAGHLNEVPWGKWAHMNAATPKQLQCQEHDLEFDTLAGASGGLESLKVSCRNCGAGNLLAGLSTKDSLKRLNIKCRGGQPWQRADKCEVCTETPQVAQRGASNVHYSALASALDISCGQISGPDEDIELGIRGHSMFNALKGVYDSQSGSDSDPAVLAIAGLIAGQTNTTVAQVIALLGGANADAANRPERKASWQDDIFEEEYRAFCTVQEDTQPHDRFITETVFHKGNFPAVGGEETSLTEGLSALVDRVVIAHRLREVRAFTGFQRYSPDRDRTISPSLGTPTSWLPAIEVFGEGIFVSFSETMLQQWEHLNRIVLSGRVGSLVERHAESNFAFLPFPTPRFLMLHTLAHMLIRQLSFECGYSASSLKERIYCATPNAPKGPQAGVLIYTADSDSEGSLGGLARQGRPDRFVPMLIAALRKALWCSSDPICSELPNQGLAGLNRAACHACALIAETSCSCCNLLLDRVTLIGEPGGKNYGFFSNLGL